MDKKVYFSGFLTGAILLIVLQSAGMGLVQILSKSSAKPEKKIEEIYGVLDKYFVNEYDKQELTEGMYAGMVKALEDPYTTYMDKDVFKNFMDQTEGSYAGIGVVVSIDPNDNRIVVVSPFEGLPGYVAGMMPGDKIIKVNGEDVFGENLQEVTNKLKGKAGTSVAITLLREKNNNEVLDIEVVRDTIELPTVAHKKVGDNLGYIQITSFDRVTYDQFMKSYNELMSDGIKGLIVDVRNNPGGLLDIVTKISDVFVPEGNVVYTEDKNGNRKYYPSDSNKIEIPLAILVNGNSASASEVLSGAVKDMEVGFLVGTTTYGKGLVQNLYPLSDDSALKVTIAKYYTPNGICIDGEGIKPDYEVEMPDELSARISALTLEEDVQLQKAISEVELRVK